MTKNRLEAFSDGVIAIIITIILLASRNAYPSQISFQGDFREYLPQSNTIFVAKVLESEIETTSDFNDYVYTVSIVENIQSNLKIAELQRAYYRFHHVNLNGKDGAIKSVIVDGCGLALRLQKGTEYIFMGNGDNGAGHEILWVEPVVNKSQIVTALKNQPDNAPNPRDAIKNIAADIEKLKPTFPQLKNFSASNNLDPSRLVIEYAYHTHKATHIGGWTAGVPNPDDDGLWFRLDIHDPNSQAQIHTQPGMLMSRANCIGQQVVSYLILEGKKPKSIDAAIGQILKTHSNACED